MLALMVPLFRGRADILPWAVAGLVALAVHEAGLGQPWPVLAGALLGAAVGAWRAGKLKPT